MIVSENGVFATGIKPISTRANTNNELEELFGLKGRKAVVSGAARGIGFAIASAYAAVGANVVMLDRDAAALDLAVAAVDASGGQVSGLAVDLAAPLNLDKEARADFAEVDVLVSNAGFMTAKPFQDHMRQDFQDQFNVHVLGATELMGLVLPGMKSRGYGRVILMASIAAERSRVPTPGYSAAKGALVSLTRSIAQEFGRFGITCNAIAPGPIRTAMSAKAQGDPVVDAGIRARIPVGRWGEPEDLAPLAVLLAGRGAAFISGEMFTVDGGAGTNV